MPMLPCGVSCQKKQKQSTFKKNGGLEQAKSIKASKASCRPATARGAGCSNPFLSPPPPDHLALSPRFRNVPHKGEYFVRCQGASTTSNAGRPNYRHGRRSSRRQARLKGSDARADGRAGAQQALESKGL
ncbi:hypothetical protein IF1G_10769 [Cordyceps javanica]|uniref:Uncharacterized protein n=1 Tax=Cordyceps javanica TaxID=43265 RepID=A0A545UMD6_9HYPO|nr:hypothetical protein IF1G_10769 [Cordyceps javanica]